MSSRRTLYVFALLLGVFYPRLSYAADVTVAWDPPSDGLTTGYLLAYGTSPGSYSKQLNVGFTTSYVLQALADGATYYLVVRAYDAAGNFSDASPEISATVAPSTPPVVTALSLSSNVPSPQVPGTTVNWLATASGGVVPYEFQWSLYHSGAWTIQSWASASAWTWVPSAPATDFQVRVAVRSSGSTSTSGELSQTVPFTVTTVSGITLSASGFKVKGVKGASLNWGGASGSTVDVYRNGAKIAATTNDGDYTDNIGGKGSGTFIYKLCAAGTAICSNNSTVVF